MVRYRYSVILLRQLVKTDFKLRYQGSALGYAWSLLRPLFLFAILYVVFSHFLKVGEGVPNYPVYLLVGIVLWNYFLEITSGNVTSVVGKGDLIRKLNFPRYILVLSGAVSAVINLLLNSVIILLFIVLAGADVSLESVWILPLLIAELTIIGIGTAFVLSTLYVRFRDIGYIWEVIAQAAFYLTPILYPLSLAPEVVRKYLLLNPIAQIIQDVRNILVTPSTITIADIWHPLVWLIPIGTSIGLMIVGGVLFRRRSRFFAEEV